MTLRRRRKLLIGESTLVCHSEFAEVVFDRAYVPQTWPLFAECLRHVHKVNRDGRAVCDYCACARVVTAQFVFFSVHSQGNLATDGKIVVLRSNSQEVVGNP